jgi:hypothetical protein
MQFEYSLFEQTGLLLLLALPIACISWTITHEELFKEFRDYFLSKLKRSKSIVAKKFYYVFTCEYCLSHYVTVFFLILTNYHLVLPDWRGYLIAGFGLVWIANIYMSLYGILRVGLKREKVEVEIKEEELGDKSIGNSK